MKRKTLLAAALCLAFLAENFAQNDRRFHVGGYLASTVSYRKSTAASSADKPSKDLLDDATSAKQSGSAGLFAELVLNKKNSLRLAAEFANLGYQLKNLTFSSPEPSPEGRGFLRENHNYLAVPVGYERGLFEKNAWRASATVGGGPAFFLSQSSVFKFDGDRSVEHRPDGEFNQTAWAGQFGFGVSRPIGRGLVLEVQPRARYFFTGLRREASPVKFNLWDAGLQAGIRF